MRRWLSGSLFLLACLATTGCRSSSRYQPAVIGYAPVPAAPGMLGPQPARPIPPPGSIPAGPFPTVPPGQAYPIPAAPAPAAPTPSGPGVTDGLPPAAPPPALPPSAPSPSPSYRPPADQWTPAQPPPARSGVRTPEPPSRNPVLLYPPEIGVDRDKGEAVPPVQTPPPSSGSLPAGIPGFAMVGKEVATGLRPSLDGGLDWLQQKSYRVVLHLRAPGQDDAADRRQVEKRGMKYLSVEVAPTTLTRKFLEDFVRVVQDPGYRPLFVYDGDGSLAGPLWYAYFRLGENASDDLARIRAAGLGLREDQQRDLFAAVRRLADEPR